jgi:ribonuclease HI
MELKFVKVRGHSGDKYNDMADALARKALGL